MTKFDTAEAFSKGILTGILVVTAICIALALGIFFWGWVVMLTAGAYGLAWSFWHSVPLGAAIWTLLVAIRAKTTTD